MGRRLALCALLTGALALPPGAASAAEAPILGATWVTEVTATSARLRAEINPGGTASFYRFEYLTEAAYEANLEAAKDPFAGAARAPASGSAGAGSGLVAVAVSQHIGNLSPSTSYRYRVVASSSAGAAPGPVRSLGTEEATNVFHLLDSRGWEMVSPADKNGGEIQPPEAIFGGGTFQAAASGQSLTYSSADSFAGGKGAPPGSQYIATRTGSNWSTGNITAPLRSGAYGDEPDGVPFRLFSEDLSRGLLFDGRNCGAGPPPCPLGYSLREGSGSALTQVDQAPALRFEGASTDLRHVVLGSPAGLEEWSEGGLGPVSEAPGAVLAAPAGAISSDGSRIYFTELEDGPLRLWEAGETKLLAETVGGGGAFQAASADGRYAFYLKGAHLYRWDVESEAAEDLTPAGGIAGVLGVSSDGSVAYYQDASGLHRWEEGSTAEVAPGPAAAAPSDWPPATGTARVSPDGSHLLFLSKAELTGYENNGMTEIFLYGPPPGGDPAVLACVSCNPTGERPEGSSSIPGAVANGTTRAYKPRVLSASGNRVFFDSEDDLSPQDSNKGQDVYEWEAQGEGSCGREEGCTQLISSGRDGEPSTFIDASESGSDAFFITAASLAYGDGGSYDLYDAREGGGFPTPEGAIPCEGDACQPLPEAPEDPTPGTLVPNGGNPAPRFTKVTERKHKPRHHKKKHKRRHKHRGGGRK